MNRSVSSSTIVSAAGSSRCRRRRLAAQAVARSSTEYSQTPGRLPIRGSKSRGTARSRTTSGRPPRCRSTSANSVSVTTGSVAAVVLTTTSAAASSAASSEKSPGRAPSRAASSTARVAVRLTTVTSRAPASRR
jgi:hypothetical protein